MTIDGVSTTVFNDTVIVQAAKDYFGCDTLSYVRLENQGGSGNKGSHWERRLFGNEVN